MVREIRCFSRQYEICTNVKSRLILMSILSILSVLLGYKVLCTYKCTYLMLNPVFTVCLERKKEKKLKLLPAMIPSKKVLQSTVYDK